MHHKTSSTSIAKITIKCINHLLRLLGALSKQSKSPEVLLIPQGS